MQYDHYCACILFIVSEFAHEIFMHKSDMFETEISAEFETVYNNLAEMSRGVDSWIRSDFVNGRSIASWLSYLCCFYEKEKRVTS